MSLNRYQEDSTSKPQKDIEKTHPRKCTQSSVRSTQQNLYQHDARMIEALGNATWTQSQAERHALKPRKTRMACHQRPRVDGQSSKWSVELCLLQRRKLVRANLTSVSGDSSISRIDKRSTVHRIEWVFPMFNSAWASVSGHVCQGSLEIFHRVKIHDDLRQSVVYLSQAKDRTIKEIMIEDHLHAMTIELFVVPGGNDARRPN